MSPPSKYEETAPGTVGRLAAARPPTVLAAAMPEFFTSARRLLPGVTIPLRSMLVAGSDQHILVSPIGTTEELAGVGRRLVALVAPNLVHYRHVVEAWKRLHATAVWGPPGITEKLPQLADVRILGTHYWPHRDVLDFVVVQGAPRRNEVVFFHRPSRTLYTADLVVNIHELEGPLAPVVFRMLGVHRRFAMIRPWRRWVVDRAAFARSMRRILDWDFERIAMAHGEVVDLDARERLVEALRDQGLVA